MLTTPKLAMLQELIAGASREELIWLSGYLAGVVAGQGQAVGGPQGLTGLVGVAGQGNGSVATVHAGASGAETPAAPAIGKITIAYGTETGNSKKLASDFAAKAKKKGINAKLVGLEQYRLNDLPKEEYFFTVISTQGDGEPPAAAKKFYDHLHQPELKLDRLKYGVLALGDTSYPLFCKAGEDVDQQLQKAGAQRIATLEKCDTDYESQAGSWFDTILQQLSQPSGATGSAGNGAAAPSAASPAAGATVKEKSIGKKIYTGTILNNINLNDRGSFKQTHHLEIAAEAVDYQPGDSLGLVPENPTFVVDAILSLTGADADRKLTHKLEETTLGHLLRKRLNIVYLPERVVRKYAAIVKQEIPETRIGLLDLLKIYPVRDAAQFHEVIGILEPTAPRLYSISSAPEAHSGEIHLTVAKDKFAVNGEIKHGLCSDLLSQLTTDQTFEFYIHKNWQFRLPAPHKDVIMIGPGTGIAPFRSFLAERDSTGAEGRNWLFFGDQHFTTDFLYQTELQNWLQTGVLTRLNTAFSRDQKEKIYVQHRMQQEAAELYRWLEKGASVYVCGAKAPMSVDVEATLLNIIEKEGKKTPAETEAFFEEMQESNRYVKDVY